MSVLQNGSPPRRETRPKQADALPCCWRWFGASGAVVALVDTILYEAYSLIVIPPDWPAMGSARPLYLVSIALMNVTIGFPAGAFVGFLSGGCVNLAMRLAKTVMPEYERLRKWAGWLILPGSGVFMGWILTNIIIVVGDFLTAPGGYERMLMRQRWTASAVTFDFYGVAVNTVPVVIFAIGSLLAAACVHRRLG